MPFAGWGHGGVCMVVRVWLLLGGVLGECAWWWEYGFCWVGSWGSVHGGESMAFAGWGLGRVAFAGWGLGGVCMVVGVWLLLGGVLGG